METIWIPERGRSDAPHVPKPVFVNLVVPEGFPSF